ncbi:MAG TPA: DMT family transporter [Bacteroidetes bacterium]|nr:DMT family transporter [Bacteroidota bacterium]
MKGNWIAHIFLFGAALIYGANYSIAKVVLDGGFISPMGLVFFRVLSAFLIFFLFHVFFIKEKIDKKDLPKVLKVTIFGIVINQSFFIIGLKHTVPINAALLLTVVPILVFAFSAYLLKEKIGFRKIIGVGLAFVGVLSIILNKGSVQFSFENMKGDIFVFLNSVSYAYYLVSIKPLLKKYNPVTITKWMFLFGLIIITPFGISGAINVDWETFTTDIWIAFIYVLVFTTFLAYLFNILALRKVNPSVVGVYVYLQPILATIIAYMMGKDSLNFEKILAGILIFTGVYLVSSQNKKLSD